jgi:hypothetical protein
MDTKTIISETGKAHGFGSDPWKWVSGLSDAEREHVKNGTAIVLVDGAPGYAGTTIRRVLYSRGRYIHRMP